MHIALVTETYPPEVNGVAMTLNRMAEGLLRRGHQVHLVRPRQHDGDLPIRGLHFHETLVCGLPIPRYQGLRFGLPAKNRLVKVWREHRPDIVHVATEGPLGWSAISAANTLGLPVSSGFHTNFDAYSRHYGLGWLRGAISRYMRKLHNRTGITLVPTRILAQELTKQGYRNVAVVSRGVDTQLFNPARRSQALRASWGAAQNELVVCYVGRLAPEKNLDLVLESIAAMRERRYDVKGVFIGEGPQLKPLAARHPEYCFAGLRRGEDLARHYASADIFLFPSLTETFGNVTAEALASGLGVVSYRCAGAADLIVNGENGLLAAPGDSPAFVDAAIRLATHPTQRDHVRRHAAASVAHLDWERIHDTFIETLRQRIDCGSIKPH